MDPVTQGVLGATATLLVSSRKEKMTAAALGFFSGMAADLDVLIASKTDPLLALEYHRHFTHSLIFIPVGALLCALMFYCVLPVVKRVLKRRLSFARTYFYCLAGYATHALLDACTTYGTQLFWPFSHARVAWNNVSVVDPLFTLPLIILLVVSLLRRSSLVGMIGVVYCFFYLGLGVVQNSRAQVIAYDLANSRGHKAINLGVKPSLGNLIAWKSVYEYDGRFYVDAVRVLWAHKIIEGGSTEKLDLNKHFLWLEMNTQQARDIQRFSWFSNHHLGIDPDNENRIIDIRYSLLPNEMTGMWGITLNPNATSSEHVIWSTTRPNGDNVRKYPALLWKMIKS